MTDEIADLRRRLDRLESREACVSTFNEYLHYLDGDRLDELLDIFEADAILDVANYPPGSGKDLHFEGRGNIRALYAPHHGGIGRHHSANVTVNVTGDLADLSAYFITSGAYGFGGGLYQITFRRNQGKWLIHRMRIVSTWGWRVEDQKPPYLANTLGEGALRGGRPVVYRIT
ncbi:MAG: nuclear transport factor 2 family protein [Dehalococcoidia bacterium]